MSNNFDEPVLIDDGISTPATPADYLGFGRAAGTAVSTGPRVYAGTGDPRNTLTAPAGSIYMTSDGGAGSVGSLYVNDDGAVNWVLASAVV